MTGKFLFLLCAAVGLTLAAAFGARADVTLPSLIADNMVLQRGVPVHLWGKADPGEAITLSVAGQTARTVAGPDGGWDIRLKPLKAGGPYEMTVAGKNTVSVKNVLVGEVWVCSGQSNMSFPLAASSTGKAAIAASANPQIRLFHVPLLQSDTPLTDVKASWSEANPQTVPGFSAVGYFFGRDLQKALGVPIGLIQSDVGGTPGQFWTPESALRSDPYLKKAYLDVYATQYQNYLDATAAYEVAAKKAKEDGKPLPYKPDAPWRYSTLYNGMIAPLTPYTIAGACWYQGENNTDNPIGYRRLLPALIASWRSVWGESRLPFLVVQLAPWSAPDNSNPNYAEVREAQSETVETTPRTGLAVITDVGDEKSLHPLDKETVGERLALLARKIAYGQKIVAQGPTLRNATGTGNTVTLRFDNVGGGLVARGGMSSGSPVPEGVPVGFTLAGPDGKLLPATAWIVGRDTVVVSSPEVAQPETVAYGFANYPVVNLWNKDGLPATPFRASVKHPGEIPRTQVRG